MQQSQTRKGRQLASRSNFVWPRDARAPRRVRLNGPIGAQRARVSPTVTVERPSRAAFEHREAVELQFDLETIAYNTIASRERAVLLENGRGV